MKHLPIAFILSAAALSLPAAAYNSISVPGTPEMFGAEWNPSANLLSTRSGSAWSGSITPQEASGEFKFAADKSWDVNWGGNFSVLRVPARGVGPLSRSGANLSWHNAAARTAHTFVFHEDTATFDILPKTTNIPSFSSVQLVGGFNGDGASTNGILSRSGSVWSGEIAVGGGSDSFQLLVNGSDRWGPAGTFASALPATNVSMCGASSLSVSGIKRGTLAVSFDAASLLLSVSQATTAPFEAKYVAADVSFAAGSPCDVNLEETDDGNWAADFVVSNASSIPFTLSLSERDTGNNQGGFYWGATNASSAVRSYPFSEFLSRTGDPASVVPLKCQGGAGRYRVSFSPASQELSVRRLYSQTGRVNLLNDPSLEICDDDGRPTASGGVSAWNARIVDAVLDNGVRYGAHSGARAAFFPPAGGGQDDSSASYGSLSCDVSVTNGAGASLFVSAYLRAYQSWNGTAQIQITWIGANGAAVGEHRFDLLNPDPVAWKAYSTEAPVPDNARSAHVVWLYSSAPETGGLLLDDLEIRLASSRSQNFDAWTSILGKWAAFSPDWAVSPYGKTVDNSKDVALPPGGVLISKYIEGTGNNKAIEIFNGTDDAVDLSQYNLVQYDNGATSPTNPIQLSGTLAPGACFVVTRPVHNTNYPPDSALLAAAASSGMTSKLLTFNGDDVVVLRKGTAVVDRVGQVSAAATNAFWAYVCKNRTLARKSTVHTGTVSAVTAAFDLSQWDLLPCDDFTDLGSHSRSLGDDVFVPSGLSLVFHDNASLVSPLLDGGIGDLSFWYRAATATNAAAATLRVEASADESFASSVFLTNITVSPTLVFFTNISLFVNRSDLSFLRFTETTGAGSSHVRIDDISTTPAVPASRYQDFNVWTNADWARYDGNYQLASWRIVNGRIASTNGSSGTPAALLKTDSFLTSPGFASGIGTVVFLAARDASAGSSDPARITFQISHDGGTNWTDAASISVTNTAWASMTVPADIPSGAAVKFLSSGDSPLLLDNIELRVYEGTARSQNFNTWPNSNSYGALSGQGWSVDEGYIENGDDGKMLRMKTKNKALMSPVFSGGLGTLSLDAKSFNASKASAFSVDISTNGGTSWSFNVFSNATTAAFKTYSYPVRNPAVNRVRISQANGNSLNLDNVVCGIIQPAPSVSVTPSVSPDPLDVETPFTFSASVQPSGDAAVSAVSVRWQTVVGRTTNAWTTNALSYSAALDRWVSPAFAPLAEGTRLQYQAFARWSSAEYSTTQTTYSDICTNLASAVAGGGVWINEIFCTLYDGEFDPDDLWSEGVQNHEFIEICGPTNQSLAGWYVSIEFARAQEIAANSNIVRYARISLLAGANLNHNATEDGYGFYVIGDDHPANCTLDHTTNWTVNKSLGTSYVPATVDREAAAHHNNLHDLYGVIRLYNNNGSLIDAISYGRNVGSLSYAGKQPDERSSLSLSGSNGYHAASFSWNSTTNATPGSANPGQSFSNAPVSRKVLPDRARHNPTELVVPTIAGNDPFYMLDPQPVCVTNIIDFALAFPAAYLDRTAGTLFLRRENDSVWSSYSLAHYDGVTNAASEEFLHLPRGKTFPAYSFSRLETVSYYFSITPPASGNTSYLTGYVASDGNGGSIVYSNETDAISHPFTVTFPFHDTLVITNFCPAPTGNQWIMAVLDEGDYTGPDWSELRLEVNTNGLPAGLWSTWTFWDPLEDPIRNPDEESTEYRLSLDLPPSPAFFRLAPARQPAE